MFFIVSLITVVTVTLFQPLSYKAWIWDLWQGADSLGHKQRLWYARRKSGVFDSWQHIRLCVRSCPRNPCPRIIQLFPLLFSRKLIFLVQYSITFHWRLGHRRGFLNSSVKEPWARESWAAWGVLAVTIETGWAWERDRNWKSWLKNGNVQMWKGKKGLANRYY